jgi:hypothetical protein
VEPVLVLIRVAVGDRSTVSAGGDYNDREAAGLTAGLSSSS